MKRLLLIVLLAACKQAPQAPQGPSPEERAEAARLVAPLLEKARARDAERKKGLVEALAKLSPHPELGNCPVTVSLPDPRRKPQGFDLDRMKRELEAAQRVELTPLKPEALARVDGPLFHAVQRRLQGVPTREVLDEVGADSYWDYDVVVVEDARNEAARAGEGFVAGEFHGRALLWSFPQHKILCMAEVNTQSSSRLKVQELRVGGDKVSDNFQTAAGVDLLQNVLRDSLSKLVLAGPSTMK